MPDALNVDALVNLLNALAQRQEVVRQLVGQLQSSTVWRSPDGQLAIALTDAQRNELVAFARTYLDESEAAIAAARAMLPQQANLHLDGTPVADAGGGR